MNIVHKVAVLFHAQDRITRHLDKMTDKFHNVQNSQRGFENAQKQAGRTAEQLAAAQRGHMAQDERYAARRQALATQQGVTAEQLALKLGTLGNKRAAAEGRTLAAEQGIEAQRRKMWNSHLAQMEVIRAREGQREAALFAEQTALASTFEKRLDALAAKRALLANAGARMAPVAYTEAVSNRNTLRSNVHGMQDDRRLWMGQLRVQTEAATVEMIEREIQLLNREIGQQQTILNQEQKRIAAHEELVVLDQQHLALQAEQRAAVAQFTAQRRQANAEAKFADEAELARALALYESKAAHQAALIEQRQAALQQQLAGYAAEAEAAERVAVIKGEANAAQLTAMEREEAARERALALEKRIAQVQQRSADRRSVLVAAEERTAGRRQMASSGAGNLMGGLMGVAMAGYVGHHLVKKGAEEQMLQRKMKLNIYGKKDKDGRLWSDVINERITNNAGRIPGTKLNVSTVEQRHIIDEQLGAAIAPENAIKNLVPIAKAQRYFQMNGKEVKGLASDLATILERTGAMDEKDTIKILDQIVRSANVSSRFTPKAVREILIASSGRMRSMKMDMSDFSLFDYLLAGDPSGSRNATQYSGMLEVLSRGGMNDTARAMFGKMFKSGTFKSYQAAPFKNKKGKTVTPALTPILADLTPMEVVNRVRDFVLKEAKVDKKKFMSNKISNEERAALSNVMGTLFPAMRGSRMMQTMTNPVEVLRALEEQHKKNTTLGLDGSVNAGTNDDQYNNAVLDAKEAFHQLEIELGKNLLPTMTGFMRTVSGLSMTLADVARNNPWIAQGGMMAGMGVGGALALGGTAKIAGWALGGLVDPIANAWRTRIAASTGAGMLAGATGTQAAAGAARFGVLAGAGIAAAGITGGVLFGTWARTELLKTDWGAAFEEAAQNAIRRAVHFTNEDKAQSEKTVREGAAANPGLNGKGYLWDWWEKQNQPKAPGAAPPRTGAAAGGTTGEKVAPYMEGAMPHTLTVRIVSEGDGEKNQKAARQTGDAIGDALRRTFPTVSTFNPSGAQGALPTGVTRR